MADNQDLDLSFLYEIADGSNEFIIESITMFLHQTPQLLAAISGAVQSQDWPAAGASAHKLKPNLGFFGMPASQATMQEIEIMCKESAPDALQIASKFEQVKAVVTSNLTELEKIKSEKEAES